MKVVSAAVAALVLAAAGSAQAAIVTDVDNLVLPPAGTNSYSGAAAILGESVTVNMFQTWTPTVLGQLARLDTVSSAIAFAPAPSSPFAITLSIYSGDVREAGVVELGQLDFTSTSIGSLTGQHSFDLSSLSISTSPGSLMTFGFSIKSCATSATCVFGVNENYYSSPGGTLLATSNGGYGGGQQFVEVNGVFSAPIGTDTGNDLSFRISVDDAPVAGVPEPGVWGLMLCGLFGVGGLLRRRTAILHAHA